VLSSLTGSSAIDVRFRRGASGGASFPVGNRSPHSALHSANRRPQSVIGSITTSFAARKLRLV